MNDTTNRNQAADDYMVVGRDGDGPWLCASGRVTMARARSLVGHLTAQGQRDEYKIITIED